MTSNQNQLASITNIWVRIIQATALHIIEASLREHQSTKIFYFLRARTSLKFGPFSLLDTGLMGNTSCIPAITRSNSGTKVVRWDGTLSVYPRPVKAADVMVDNPGQFICPATNLQVGFRVSGLVADQELDPQMLYFILPMKLLYSVLTSDEVSDLNTKAHKAAKFGSFHNWGKFFPGFGEFCKFPSEEKRSESDGKEQITEPDTSITVFVRQRSWRPALETIVEVC